MRIDERKVLEPPEGRFNRIQRLFDDRHADNPACLIANRMTGVIAPLPGGDAKRIVVGGLSGNGLQEIGTEAVILSYLAAAIFVIGRCDDRTGPVHDVSDPVSSCSAL